MSLSEDWSGGSRVMKSIICNFQCNLSMQLYRYVLENKRYLVTCLKRDSSA